MKKLFVLPALIALLTLAVRPASADGAFIRVFAPLSGAFSIIGGQIEAVSQAIEPGIRVVDTQCDADVTRQAAKTGLAEGISVFVGFPCVESLDAAIEALEGSNTAIITLGVQVDGITEPPRGKAQQVYRMGARASDEVAVLSTYLKSAWRGVNFAIIDDGTLQGRQIAEGVRFALSGDNLEPVFTDTYRPLLDNQAALVRRLQKAGATHVVIGGDAYDAAIIAANAEQAGYELTLAGGSAFLAPAEDGKLPDGTAFAAGPVDDWAELTKAAIANALDAVGRLPASGADIASTLGNIRAKNAGSYGPFLPNGELGIVPVVMYRMTDGKPVAITRPLRRVEPAG